MTGRHMAVAHLFRSTAQAHHRAFAATSGDDPDWPEWYARELVGPLSSLLGSALDSGYLAAALRAVDQHMRRRAPGYDWALYYADWFLAHDGAQPWLSGSWPSMPVLPADRPHAFPAWRTS